MTATSGRSCRRRRGVCRVTGPKVPGANVSIMRAASGSMAIAGIRPPLMGGLWCSRDPLYLTPTRSCGPVRVLLADDERLLADTVADGLRKLAMAVDVCYDGEAAIERLAVNRYDVAVLDRDMPGRTGDDVCRWLVGTGLGTRILI